MFVLVKSIDKKSSFVAAAPNNSYLLVNDEVMVEKSAKIIRCSVQSIMYTTTPEIEAFIYGLTSTTEDTIPKVLSIVKYTPVDLDSGDAWT